MDRPTVIRVRLSESTNDAIDRWCTEYGQTKERFVGRALDWLLSRPREAVARIIFDLPPPETPPPVDEAQVEAVARRIIEEIRRGDEGAAGGPAAQRSAG